MISKFNFFILVALCTIHVFAAPSIILESPAQTTFTTTQSSITFKGATQETLTLTINGKKIALGPKGSFLHTEPLQSKNSQNFYLITATDGTLETHQQISVFYKDPISISAPPTPSAASVSSIELAHGSDRLLALKKLVGEQVNGTYSFSDISLSDYIKIFSSDHKINIINSADNDKLLSVTLSDMHPVDVFNALIEYWGVHWIYSDDMIRIVDQAPVRVFNLNYMNTSEMIPILSGLNKNMTYKANLIDNSIIAQGPFTDLDYISNVIKKIDTKPKQVLIEATIVETNFDISSIIGVNPSAITKVADTASDTGSPFNLRTYSVQFPMSVFENDSNANILANPQILVTNHQEASINTGNQIGYTTSTTTETSTIENVSFLTTGITLKITPHITDNGEILMEINPTISEGQVSNNKPMSSNTSTKTQVIIKDGETIVIGGLIQRKKTKVKSKIPILSDIPILNLFFSQTETKEQKMELSVLITPHIIDDSTQINEAKSQ
jgi:type II secretory pathway component GspD/PulD (secretin)